jgi:hypothetical protein
MELLTMRGLTVFGLTLSLGGMSACATPTYNYAPSVQNISRPPLQSVNRVGVGEQMLVQGVFIEREALYLDREVRVGTLGSYTFTPGHFVRVGGTGNVGFYNQSAIVGSGTVQQGAMTDPFQVIEYDNVTKQICGVTVLNLKTCKNVPEARVGTVSSQGDNSFQQTLIYSGRVGNKINIGYREFSSNIARPAFNNDVEYDLTESQTIGYRGAEIEILEANNQYIRYRVIRNFNAALQ